MHSKFKVVSFLHYLVNGDDHPSLKDLIPFGYQYCALWMELGLQLGIPSSKLEVIHADNSHDLHECYSQMMNYFLQIEYRNATWKRIMDAFAHIDVHWNDTGK